MGQYPPGFTFVLLNLVNQVLHAFIFDFRAQIFNKFNCQVFMIDIIIKIQEQSFDVSLRGRFKGGADPTLVTPISFSPLKLARVAYTPYFGRIFCGLTTWFAVGKPSLDPRCLPSTTLLLTK